MSWEEHFCSLLSVRMLSYDMESKHHVNAVTGPDRTDLRTVITEIDRMLVSVCKVKSCIPQIYFVREINTDIRRLTTGIRSEKCVVRRFRRCANVYLHKPR